MIKINTLERKMERRIARKKGKIVLRKDFVDLGGYDQVGRVLKNLVAKKILIRIGYGVYTKTQISLLTQQTIPKAPLPELAREALKRLNVAIAPSTAERQYSAGQSTQVPTGRVISVKSRITRKIGYGGTYVKFEKSPK